MQKRSPWDGRPFSCVSSILFDAHHPLVPPAPFLSIPRSPAVRANTTIPTSRRRIFADFTADEIEFSREQYEGVIGYIDHSVGRMLTELGEARGC